MAGCTIPDATPGRIFHTIQGHNLNTLRASEIRPGEQFVLGHIASTTDMQNCLVTGQLRCMDPLKEHTLYHQLIEDEISGDMTSIYTLKVDCI